MGLRECQIPLDRRAATQGVPILGCLAVPRNVHVAVPWRCSKQNELLRAASGARLRVCGDEAGEGEGREKGRGRIRQQSEEVLLARGECPRPVLEGKPGPG